VARNVVFAAPGVFEAFGLPEQISTWAIPPAAMSPGDAAGTYR